MATYTAIVLWRYRENSRYTPIVALVMGWVNLFFTVVLAFASNPFETLGFVPQDGAGLNPMLQNMGLWLHLPHS